MINISYTTISNGAAVDADVVMANFSYIQGDLGEIRQYALSVTNAVTKATLNAKGWAICDGTATDTQVTSPTITGNTPDLRSKFLRHSANETTGGTGGTSTHTHTTSNTGWANNNSTNDRIAYATSATGNATYRITEALTSSSVGTLPPYYDICYFIKVKII